MISKKRTKELLTGLYHSAAASEEDLKTIQELMNKDIPFYIQDGNVYADNDVIVARVNPIKAELINYEKLNFINEFSKLLSKEFPEIISVTYENVFIELAVIKDSEGGKRYIMIEDSDKRKIALDVINAIFDEENCDTLLDHEMVLLLNELDFESSEALLNDEMSALLNEVDI